mgnify:CR=1 FL=1
MQLSLTGVRGPLFVLIGALCFSTSGFLQALAPEGASPYVVAGSRMILGSLALFLLLKAHRIQLSLKDWRWRYVLIYAFALWLFQISFFNSVLLVGVAVGTVVSIGAAPFFCGIIYAIQEKKLPAASWVVSTIIALIGLVLINSIDNASFKTEELLLPIFAGACYSVEISVSKHLTEKHSAEEAMMIITGLVGLGLLPFFAFFPVQWIFTAHGLCIALSLGVVTCAMGFTFTVEGLKTTSAPVGATLALGEPLGAALLGILALDEPSSPKTILGIALMLASVLVLVVEEMKPQERGSS